MKTNNLESLGALGLQARLAFARIGVTACIAYLLCAAGVGGWLWLVPKLHKQADARQQEISRLQRSLQSGEATVLAEQPSITEVRLANFYDSLGEKRYEEEQIRTLFAIAAKSGLALNQAEYKSSFDKNGNTNMFQIILPVKGSYAAIRQFCEKTLLAIPFSSLDEMNFKRDSISNSTLEAKLRFTLYLSDARYSAKKMAGL